MMQVCQHAGLFVDSMLRLGSQASSSGLQVLGTDLLGHFLTVQAGCLGKFKTSFSEMGQS